MKKILFLLLIIILNSCSTNYYFVNIDEDTSIYTSKKGIESVAVIPKGSGAYINTSSKKFRKVKWRNYKGWVISPVYSNSSDISNNYNSSNYNYTKSSTNSSSGGSVTVKSYTRKDGTYVRSHTRSAPKRR